jgi:recombination protein RecA
MAKKNAAATADPFALLAADIGGELLNETDSVKQWIDTGNLALNYLCSGRFVGGGIPSGKIIEIFGPSSSCKTLFGTNILKGCQKMGGFSLFLDAENSLNKEFAQKASHLETSKVLVLKADTLERAFAKMTAAIKKIREKFGNEKPLVIVYDSIAASPSEREFAETEMDEDKVLQAKDMPGERAKTCSKELRKLTPILESHNATVLFINQVRNKIGIMFGSPETTAGGGKALEYHTSLRLRTKAEKRFTDKLDNVIGMGVSVSNMKNKCFKPFIHARNMQLLYEQGINPFGGLLELLIQTERIEGCGAGNYKVNEKFTGGAEAKFKASMERNDVPFDVLLKYPSMVDAENSEQVQEYMDIFGQAVKAVDENVAKAEDIKEDEGDE